MRISRFALALAAAALGSTASVALDAPAPLRPPAPVVGFGSAREALRSGVRDYNAGNKAVAAQALEYAATQGDALALWKLGRMYADGDGVPHDDLKAFEYFSKIADDNEDVGPEFAEAQAWSRAPSSRSGPISSTASSKTYVKRDLGRAHEMFHTRRRSSAIRTRSTTSRGSISRAPASRRMRVRRRAGSTSRPRRAIIRRRRCSGTCWSAAIGIPRQRGLGLMWLTIAREGADPDKDRWIYDLYEKAFAGANERDRQMALANLEQFLKRKR